MSSRFRILFVLVVALALAAGVTACGGGGDASPEELVDSATFEGIDSANVDLTLKSASSATESSPVTVEVSGPFVQGERDLPEVDIAVTSKGKVNGNKVDFEGGLVLLPNSAFINYEGTEYEVDPATFSFVESALEQADEQGESESDSPALTACQDAAGELDLATIVKDPSDEGSVDVGGTETTKLSGTLDIAGTIAALNELNEDPACASQLNSGALPSLSELNNAEAELKRSVKTSKVELFIGDDDIIRRLVAEIEIEPGKGDQLQQSSIDLDLTLTGVNEDQEITPPSGGEPIGELFQKLNVNPLEVLGALEGEGLGNLLEQLGDSSGIGGIAGSGALGSYAECVKRASSEDAIRECASQL